MQKPATKEQVERSNTDAFNYSKLKSYKNAKELAYSLHEMQERLHGNYNRPLAYEIGVINEKGKEVTYTFIL